MAPNIDNNKTHITFITAEETYGVRHPVLRPGRPIEDCEFENDTHKDTFHLGLYVNSLLIGVVTFMKASKDIFEHKDQYQLRGMAVLEAYQGLQYGKLLVEKGEGIVKEKNGKIIWFNAREVALKFYTKCGYKIIGDAFNIPKVGTHYMMFKILK
ncbi:GNAT family N-acetyltransferase [Formosa sediminum]|uniref:GNAT family N-acetyltransferase n=1 Tax=Formosa sediminum TaxID=2594004 RepID=A0A516GMH9_9FLAO|nr:GNAT family N-acetyltransferase [Formosa sediminum]QDO92713.1 GNAT family N-acetyltransferase [Formosa sediminum]